MDEGALSASCVVEDDPSNQENGTAQARGCLPVMLVQGKAMNRFTQLSLAVLLAAAINPLTCHVRTVEPALQSRCAEDITPDLPQAETLPDHYVAVKAQVEPALSEPPPRSKEPINLVIVQDITASFLKDLPLAKEAALDMLEDSANWPAGSRIGMSTFVGGVEPLAWTPMTPIADVDSIREQWATLSSCNCTMQNEQFAQFYGEGKWCEMYYGGFEANPHMQDCFEYGHQSNPAAGMSQAIDMLEGTDGRKVIVIVGDTLPCCGPETDSRKEALVRLTRDAGARGWDVWAISTQDVDYLSSLGQNNGQARYVESKYIESAMKRVIRALR